MAQEAVLTASKRQLAAIMFTDMVGYTALMQENEAHAKTLLDRQKKVLNQFIPAYGGKIVHYYGDGALSMFPSAKEAVMAARDIQVALLQEPKVPLRIGLHIGDIIEEQEGIYGDGVNLASRIESLAEPGSILLSATLQKQIRNQPELQTTSLGTYQFKNVQDPMEVFALSSPGLPIPDRNSLQGKTRETDQFRIMVLPFVNMSAEPENSYLCDGITEEIINGLSKVEDLAIISRSTSFALKESKDSAQEIGRKLGLSHVLEGSVRRSGSRIRVSAQLITTADGFQRWSQVYDRELEDIFALQDDIACKVVMELKINLDCRSRQKRLIRPATHNLTAYNLYLKGLHHFNKWNPEDIQKARKAFEEAQLIDPGFTEVYSSLSHCYSFMGSCGIMPSAQAYAKAHEYALASVEQDSHHAESYLALGIIKFFHFWDWQGSRASLDKAEKLGLDSSLLHQIYSLLLATLGELPEAIRRMERAVQLDPLSIPLICLLGHTYQFANLPEKALKQYEQALELDPSCRTAYEGKGLVFMLLRDIPKALNAFHQYQRMTGHPLKGVTCLAYAYGVSGERKKAEEYLSKLQQRQRQEPETSLEIDIAIAYYALGDSDTAIEYLHKVYEKRFGIVCTGIVFILRFPQFQPLREHPAYRSFLDKMGLKH